MNADERECPAAWGATPARTAVRAGIARVLTAIALGALSIITGCDKSSPTASKSAPATASITVFAAASTVDVMNEAARLFEESHGVEVKCSIDSSSTLAKQIIAGAPADVFLSADEKWMDEVEKANAIDAKSRTNLLGNQLALIVPGAGRSGASLVVRMERGFDFAAALPANARIALADPAHVPAGRYARQSLEWLGWWGAVEPRMIAAQDVRGALRLVERDEADVGIVYATDAKASSNVTVIATFPLESHEPVRYPVALTAEASPQAVEFVAFLRSPAMCSVFVNAGFVVLTGER